MRRGWAAAVGLMAVVAGAGCAKKEPEPVRVEAKKAWAPPDEKTIPKGPMGDSIRLGLRIFNETPKYAAAYVGNRMSCNDCHIQSGTAKWASPMVGLPGIFPQFNQRAGRVISLAERIEDCFRRSENGRPLPMEGEEMAALLAYIQWVSQGQRAGVAFVGRGLEKLPALEGDAKRGATVYSEQCAPCHGDDGRGSPPVLPALWGPDAYNDGAGMNKVEKMAAFVHHNMPQNCPGSLTAQEAYDVAAYVASKPRGRFDGARP